MLFQSTITAALAFFIANTGAAPTADAPAAQEVQALKGRAVLGSIDVEKACDQQYTFPTFADHRGGGCNDWICFEQGTAEKPLGTLEFPVDMDKFCKTNFGEAARAECGGNVFAWQCVN